MGNVVTKRKTSGLNTLKLQLILIVFLMGWFYCARDAMNSDIRYPYDWLGTPGFGGDIDRSHIPEPSGICFHPLRKTLFVVSDEGEVVEILTDGTRVASFLIPGDLEDITVDPATGLLYIIVEGEDVILEIAPDLKEVTRRFPVARKYGNNPNFIQRQTVTFDNGIESLTFVPDASHPEGGTFYAGNQWDPSIIIELLVPLRTSRERSAEARIIRTLPFRLDDPAAMCYDPGRKVLCIVSDADNIYVEITLDGQLTAQYAFPGDNQEGIAWDDKGNLYIAQDSGGILKVKDGRKSLR